MANNEPIHSGHFMTSNPHNEAVPDDEDEDFEVDVVDIDDTPSCMPIIEKRNLHERVNKVYSLQQDEKPVTFYKFGPKKTQTIAIDVSLNKLNKCIKVAYMKMTTPKWKDFKGLKLQWKHRIRLNNVIWRAYYMEFRKPDKRKKTPTCYFAVPDDDTTHSKIEGTVIEGMYWKRRMEAICAQYKKWRTYNRHAKKKKCCKKSMEYNCDCDDNDDKIRTQQSQTPQNLSTLDDYFAYEDLDADFTNSLFDSLNVPFLFPNTKEIMQGNNADIIQPGLLSLQPSLEEIMSVVDDDTNLDALEPTFSMQQPQTSNDLRISNGRSSNYNFNSNVSPAISTTNSQTSTSECSKNYEPSNVVLNYNQPTGQSSTLPTNRLITSNLSQPLYSQAVYETQVTPSSSNLNESSVESVVGLDLKASRSNTSNINATSSLASTLDYVPQFLVSASIGQSAQNNIQTFTSVIGQQSQGQSIRNLVVDQNNQWWMTNQQVYVPEEKTLQILRSPVSQTMSQTPNNFSTTMLLSFSQANPCLQQSSIYTNPYTFSTSNFKSVQQPALQQISIQQPPNLSLPQENAISQTQQQLHLQLSQQRQLEQQQQQDPFQLQSNRQLSQLAVTTNGGQSYTQRQTPDLSHYLPQNGGGVTTPSASLASILTAGPRNNSTAQLMTAQQRLSSEIKTESILQLGNKQTLAQLSTAKIPSNNRQVWSNPANNLSIQTIVGTSVREPLSIQTNLVENLQEESVFTEASKQASKQSHSTPQYTSNTSELSNKNAPASNSYKNRRRQNPSASGALSLPASDATNSGRASTRSKRTRSQMLPDAPVASTSNSSKQHPLSQPASVQTQLSFGNEAETRSPLNTIQTDSVISDESFEERSPSAFSTKRTRYTVPCAEAADSTLHPEERKRILHLNAEKNRREALKDGFDALVQSIPVIEETGIKVTNAVVLNRAAQHIRNLRQQIEDYDNQIADCEKRHELLQKRVSIVQSSLPSNVQQSSSQSSSTMSGQIMQFFDRYVRERSNKDPRFFIMANLLKPAVETFSEQVCADSTDKSQMRNSIINWTENSFKVGCLRPLASQSLIKIATETNLINMNSNGNPTSLQDYIVHEVSKLCEFNESI